MVNRRIWGLGAMLKRSANPRHRFLSLSLSLIDGGVGTLPRQEFYDRDAAHVEDHGAGHGEPEADALHAVDHAADIDEPGRHKPQEVLRVGDEVFAAAVEIDEDERRAGQSWKW